MSKVPGNDLIDPPRNQFEFMYNKVLDAQATADRLRGLLREMPEFVWDDEQEAYFCPICGANSNHGHLGSCRLAKELDDTALGS